MKQNKTPEFEFIKIWSSIPAYVSMFLIIIHHVRHCKIEMTCTWKWTPDQSRLLFVIKRGTPDYDYLTAPLGVTSDPAKFKRRSKEGFVVRNEILTEKTHF